MIDLLSDYGPDTLPVRSTPLATAPDYVRSRNATRWHRPRSAREFPEGRVAYSYWCGAGTPAGIGQESIPTRDLLCATCEGRWKAQHRNRLIFTPRKSLAPTTCPASRTALFPNGARNPFPCLACGASVKVTGGWNRGPWVQVHATGPALVDPCPHHGWFRLRLDRRGRVMCGCVVGGGS